MLSVTDLACMRGDRRLFSGVSFTLQRGECLHVGGENGVGKTSLLRILCGLAPAEAGAVCWQGRMIAEWDEAYRQQVCYLGHHNALKDDLTALENLQVAGALAGTPLSGTAALDSLQRMGLAGREDLPVRVLSQGQKRRVALARLLTSPAALWILDEPFVALDVAAVDALAETIGGHVARGGLVILTSHQAVTIAGGVVRRMDLARGCDAAAAAAAA